MILAIVSNKGGVGKTTSAVNLAAALAALGEKTLVIDLDSQASASLSLGTRRADLAPSSYDVLLGKKSAREAIRSTKLPGVDLLTASVDLVSIESELAMQRQNEALLRQRLEPVRADYGWVFIDTPPGLSTLPRNALVASDAFLIPLVPQFLAVEGIERLLESAERLAFRYAQRLRPLGLLPTLVDARTRAARNQLAALRERFGTLVFDCEIPVNIRLAEAPEAGTSVLQWDPKSSGAHAYRLAAVELLGRAGQTLQTASIG